MKKDQIKVYVFLTFYQEFLKILGSYFCPKLTMSLMGQPIKSKYCVMYMPILGSKYEEG